MTRSRKSLVVGALLGAAATPGRLAAQIPLAFDTWTRFDWLSAPGFVEGGGFTFTTPWGAVVYFTDAFDSGDAFDVFANGVILGSTPSVPGGIVTGAATGPVAWAHPALSKGAWGFGNGAYLVTIRVREAGSGSQQGAGFIRVVPHTFIPEPGSVALVGSGLLALACAARRRRRVRAVLPGRAARRPFEP